MTSPTHDPPTVQTLPALTAAEALTLIAASACETFTSGPGACRLGRYAISPYGIHRWCVPCLAQAVLDGLPLTVHPAGWCETCGATIPRLSLVPPTPR
jgi:hypothetical protein